MALARARRRSYASDFWPGFVDAMATLLLVIIFLLSIFMLAQFFLSQEITGRDEELDELNARIAGLNEALALANIERSDLEDAGAFLGASLLEAEAERAALMADLQSQTAEAEAEGARATNLSAELGAERRATQDALDRIDLLTQEIAQLNNQLEFVMGALDASEARAEDLQVNVADLGGRLNAALVRRVQELEQYQSEFFEQLSLILGDRDDISVVGDRFVFESAVLFPFGTADLNDAAAADLQSLAQGIIELEQQIPPDIDWVLRVDGHTDAEGAADNNRLLSLQRAYAVVTFLASQGVSQERLLAAGFGESRLLDGIAPDDARQRRIEFKLTER